MHGGVLYKGGPEIQALPFPSLVYSPTTGLMIQISTPNVFPTNSGQLHLQIGALLLLPTGSKVH